MNCTDTTPIAILTVADLKTIFADLIKPVESQKREPSGHYVYGLRGIQQLFGVSHKTAQDYKNTFLQPAIKQNGRKIVIDAELAMELFNQRRNA